MRGKAAAKTEGICEDAVVVAGVAASACPSRSTPGLPIRNGNSRGKHRSVQSGQSETTALHDLIVLNVPSTDRLRDINRSCCRGSRSRSTSGYLERKVPHLKPTNHERSTK